MDIDALIASARKRVAEPRTVSQEVLVGDIFVDVEFTKLDSLTWASICAANPPRPRAKIDRVGHNVDAVTRDYPVTHLLVAGEQVSEDQWQGIFDTLSPGYLRAIGTAVWGINELEEAQRGVDLKKSLAGDSEKKSNSPANSASHPAGYPGGNPRKSRSTSTTKTES